MRVLLTGMNGTVAPAIAATLAHRGVEIAAWNRREVATEDRGAMERFLENLKPHRVVHAALGPPSWAGTLASLCRDRSIPFLHVSSVSVFAAPPNGPYAPDAVPNAGDDYGRYKRECEERVRGADPEAGIVRIGWQIGTARGSNNMIDWCEREMETKGRIEANRNWIPSCCHLDQTALAFGRLLETPPAGVRHIEGNSGGLNFPAIVRSLSAAHDGRWTIVETDGPPLDNRLSGSVPVRRSVAEKLGV